MNRKTPARGRSQAALIVRACRFVRGYARLLAWLVGCVVPTMGTAETVHGRVTFVGTLGEERQPDGSLQARFRFRLNESRCGNTPDGLWTRRRVGTAWTPWQQVSGAPIASDPAAVARGPSRTDVFALGTDNHIYWISWDGSQWSNWTHVGDELFSSGPAAVSRGPTFVDLFARGRDNTLWRNILSGSRWSGWRQVSPATISSDPAAVARGPNRIDVFARGDDNQMYWTFWKIGRAHV